MGDVETLYELVERIERTRDDHGEGAFIAWQAERESSRESVYPREVLRVDDPNDTLRVEAEGPGGGLYSFAVSKRMDGSESHFHDPGRERPQSLGPLFFAELTGSDDRVAVKRGWYDSR